MAVRDAIAALRGRRGLSAVVILALAAGTAGLMLFCRKQANPDALFVARVGNRVITAGEFRMNYEFGFPSLKSERDSIARRRFYLRAMVNELLLAQDGYARGLDRRASVTDRDLEIGTDLLTQALIGDEVVSKTSVGDDEVRRALNRSKVLFKLRYWGEPTLVRAHAVREVMAAKGYSAAIDSLRRAHPEAAIDPSMLESGYLNAFEIDPAVLAGVQNLQIGEISAPVPLNDGYYLFQLSDLRRQGIMEHEYDSKFETVKKVLLNEKYDAGIERFVSGFMTARHVTTKGAPFWALCDAVAEWKRSGDFSRAMLRDAIREGASAHEAYGRAASAWNTPLVTFAEGEFTVGALLDFFKPSLRDVDPENMPALRRKMSTEIALAVRDQLLAREARRRGLDRSPEFTRERESWKSKTVYEEVRQEIVAGLPPDAGPRAIQEALQHRADSLMNVMHVELNYAVLDTLTITESATSRMMGMQLFNLGNRKPAVPVVDGFWGLRLR
jgi:hypothetical protein